MRSMAENRKKSRLSGRYRTTVGLSISVFFIVTAVIVLALLVRGSNERIRQQTQAQTQKEAMTIRRRLDERLSILRRYYVVTGTDEDLEELLENPYDFSRYSVISHGQELLAGNKIVSDYISGYALVNYGTGSVFSSEGVYSVEEIENPESVSDLYSDEDRRRQRVGWIYGVGDSVDRLDKKFRKTVRLNGLSLYTFLPQNTLDPNAVLIAYFDLDLFIRELKGNIIKGQELSIIDTDSGRLVFATDEEFGKFCMTHQEPEQETGNRVPLFSKGKYLISMENSEEVNWNIYVGMNWDREVFYTDSLSLLVLFLLLSILLVIAYLTYRVIYNPVRLAADRISQVTEQQILPGEDELDFMTGSVNRMHTHNTALSSQLAELFIMRVMRGEISDKDIDSYLAQDAARQMPASYRIVTITLCYEGDNYDEQFAVRDACGRRLVEYLSDNYGTLLFLNPIYSSRAVICIIGEEEKDPSDSKAEMIYSAARSYIEQYPDFHAGVGVSGVHHSMHNLTAAYRESVFALNKPHSEEAPEDREQVNELQEGPVESYCRYYKKAEEAYPSINSSEYEQQLLEGIRLADKDMAYDAVNRLIRSLKENPLEDGGEVPVLLRIVNTIILGARQNNIIIDGLFRNDLRMVYRNIIGFFDLDETRRYIKYVLIDPVIDNAQYNMFSQSRAIMNAVEQVVEEKKGNVTLAECAEALNYDSSYIWKILKKEKGVTFTEYVEQYRLRMAKQLLEETDMTISAIASELYYTNAQNFIRFFSRMEGTTPGKYRQNFRELGRPASDK